MNWKEQMMGPVLITKLSQLKLGDLISYSTNHDARWCIIESISERKYIYGNYKNTKEDALKAKVSGTGSVHLRQGLIIKRHIK